MISTVYIAKNVYGGDGLGRLGDGRVIFVPGAWAGEQVRAEIIEERRGFVKARLVEVAEPCADRIAPGPCVPGMVYNALSYAAECRAKEAQLNEFFERARISVPKIEFGGDAGRSLNYRNKVVYHFAKQRGEWVIGYRTEPSHEIVDVTSDPLACPEINAKLPEIRRTVMTLLTTGPEIVRRDTAKKENLTIRWTAKTGVRWWLGDAPKDLVLKETTAGKDFEVPAGGFYQVNPGVGDLLVSAVVKEVGDAPKLLDLYCGVGVFGLAALRPGQQLTGIESGRAAIDFAKRNAVAILGKDAERTRFFAEEVGRNLRRIHIGGNTTVIIDPPRDGLEKGVARWLADSHAPRILYVSCDPATLMRDLREITRSYGVSRVCWFNMFPRTARFETLVVLDRKEV